MYVSAKESAEKGQEAVDDIKNGVHRMKKDTQDTVSKVKDDLQGAAQMARQAGAQVRDFVSNAGHGISHASDTVATQIRHNPLPAAALALGVGVILGALFSRR